MQTDTPLGNARHSNAPYLALRYRASTSLALGTLPLAHWAQRTQACCAQTHITGVLLLLGDQFLHYIEGPAYSVEAFFQGMQTLPCCGPAEELHRRPLEQRLYAQWSMVFWVDTASTLHLLELP